MQCIPLPFGEPKIIFVCWISSLFSGSEDGTVRVWNLETKKCVAVLKEHFSAVTSLALSDDGQTLLRAGRDKV